MKYLKLADVNSYLTDLDLPIVTSWMMAEFGREVIILEGDKYTTAEDFDKYYPEALSITDLLSEVPSLIRFWRLDCD